MALAVSDARTLMAFSVWAKGMMASGGHDDLADLLIGLQVTVGFDDLIQGERLGDERLEAAVTRGRAIAAPEPRRT